MYISANIIKSAIIDWNENPVITSLDSIAAPIDDLQFPTLTVCNDKTNERQDNWAFIESLMDHLDFKCSYPSTGYDCSPTNKLRSDFQFLIESIVTVYEEWLEENDKIGKSHRLFSRYFSGRSFVKVHSKILELVENGNMTLDQIKTFPVKDFSKYLDLSEVRFLKKRLLGLKHPNLMMNLHVIFSKVFKYILEIDADSSSYAATLPKDCNTTEICQKVQESIKLWFEMVSNRHNFGYLLRNFVELSNFESFNLHNNFFYDVYVDKVIIGGMANYCEVLKDKEIWLHEYFTNLSKVVDFHKSEMVSLFDVPGILSQTAGLDELIYPSLAQTFLYTQCQLKGNFSAIEKCARVWNEFLSDVMVNGSGLLSTFKRSSTIKLLNNLFLFRRKPVQ